MISKKEIYAIIGASKNPEKYGYKVLINLKESGFKVTPVNPKEEEIQGLKVYERLADIEKVDVVVFVVPPSITEKVLEEVKELGIRSVWMQPGSESEQAIKFCEENNINCVHHACIMMNHD
jgi:hypothetical protein